MKIENLLVVGVFLSLPLIADAGIFNVKGERSCKQYQQTEFGALPVNLVCAEEGTFEAPSCTEAYAQLKHSTNCCELIDAHNEGFVQERSCSSDSTFNPESLACHSVWTPEMRNRLMKKIQEEEEEENKRKK